MKKIIFGIVFILLLTSFTNAQSKIEDVKKLLEMSGSAERGIELMEAMIIQFKQILPDAPERYWDKFINEISGDDLINLSVPVYDKYFSHDEIKDIIAFYNTPTGRKLIEKLPLMSRELMSIGQEWGVGIGKKIQSQLKEDGYIDN